MSRDLGIEFAVTPWTIDELRTSIPRSRREIEDQKAFIRPELAETMLRTSGDTAFNRLYWQAYNQNKTQPKDVFDRLEHFESELERYGIKQLSEGCTAVNQQEERVRDYASLLNGLVSEALEKLRAARRCSVAKASPRRSIPLSRTPRPARLSQRPAWAFSLDTTGSHKTEANRSQGGHKRGVVSEHKRPRQRGYNCKRIISPGHERPGSHGSRQQGLYQPEDHAV